MSDLTLVPRRFVDVTPSDSATVNVTLGLYVGTSGTVKAAGEDGVVATFQTAAGQYIQGRFSRVLATGTTATGIVACFA